MRREAQVPLETMERRGQDETGAVWLNSLSGITRMQPDDVGYAFNGQWDRVRATVYDAASGIAGKAARVARSSLRASNGDLWFLTSRGVTIVDPEAVRDEPPSARVTSDSVTVDDQRRTGLVTLPPRIRRIESALLATLTRPRPVFRYRLDGFDTDWQTPSNQRRVAYTNLSPGDYTSVWNTTPAGVTNAASWPFRAARLLSDRLVRHHRFSRLAASPRSPGAAVCIRFKIRVLLKERVRLSREIHDTLLQSLVGVALQLEQVEHDVDASPAGRQRLVKARKQVEEYISEARESILNLRSSKLEREGLPEALRHAGERAVAEADDVRAPIDWRFAVEGSPDRCGPDIEEQLLRIGQEAVTNATRHSGARHVTMALHYGDETVTLRVSDDGCGFDPAHLTSVNGGHWGLVNMRERAGAVGGTLDISSAPGRGTEIEAVVPRNGSPRA